MRSPPAAGPILIVFDVDGTLTRTMGVDSECFVRALGDVFGATHVDQNWGGYRHTTDEAILNEALERHRGHRPTSEERAAFVSRLCQLLGAALATDASLATPIAGVQHALAALRDAEISVTLASGAYNCSVMAKLTAAGLDEALVMPRATGDDGETRETIVQCAMARAATAAGVERFARVVAVGDAVWDVRTARRLALPFIGIAAETPADILTGAGATTVLADYGDLTQFLAAVGRAEVPGSPEL